MHAGLDPALADSLKKGSRTTLASYAARTTSKAAFLYLSSVSSTGWYMAPRTFLPNRSLSILSTFTWIGKTCNLQTLEFLPKKSFETRVVDVLQSSGSLHCDSEQGDVGKQRVLHAGMIASLCIPQLCCVAECKNSTGTQRFKPSKLSVEAC